MAKAKTDPVPDLLARGRRLLEQENYDKAATIARRARKSAPKQPGPVLLAAQVASLRDGPDRKVEILLDGLKTVGNDLPIRRQLATTFLQTGKLDAARAEADKIRERGAANFADCMILARCAFAEEDFDQAEQWANRARDLAPDRAAPVLLLARIAQRRDDPRQSIDLLKAYQKTGREDIRVVRQLVDAFVQIGDLKTARAWTESIIASGEVTVRDYLLLARICLDERNHEQAESFATQALALAGPHPAPVLLLSRIAEVQGGLEAKVKVLKSHVGHVQEDFGIRMRLADAYMNQGRTDDALAVLRPLDPERHDDEQIFALTGMYEMCGRPDLARDFYSHVDANGSLGGALLLTNVLSGAMDLAAALDSHGRKGLAKDSYYHALNAYRRKLAAGDAEGEGDDLGPEARRKLGQYLDASAYFDLAPAGSATEAPLVSIVAPIHRVQDEANLVRQLVRQDYPALEAIVVVNGPGIDAENLRAVLEHSGRFQRVHVEVLPSTASLPTSLNTGLSLSQGAFIARFDADDIYMDRYISRTVALMRQTSADLCGKPHLFVHFEKLGCNTTLAVADIAYGPTPVGHQPQGSGSTLVMTRAVASKIRFDETLRSGEDRDVYLRSNAAGFKMVYAPPFDHIVMRREDKTGHTWKLGDARMLKDTRNGYFLSSGSIATLERLTEGFLRDAGCVS